MAPKKQSPKEKFNQGLNHFRTAIFSPTIIEQQWQDALSALRLSTAAVFKSEKSFINSWSFYDQVYLQLMCITEDFDKTDSLEKNINFPFSKVKINSQIVFFLSDIGWLLFLKYYEAVDKAYIKKIIDNILTTLITPVNMLDDYLHPSLINSHAVEIDYLFSETSRFLIKFREQLVSKNFPYKVELSMLKNSIVDLFSKKFYYFSDVIKDYPAAKNIIAEYQQFSGMFDYNDAITPLSCLVHCEAMTTQLMQCELLAQQDNNEKKLSQSQKKRAKAKRQKECKATAALTTVQAVAVLEEGQLEAEPTVPGALAVEQAAVDCLSSRSDTVFVTDSHLAESDSESYTDKILTAHNVADVTRENVISAVGVDAKTRSEKMTETIVAAELPIPTADNSSGGTESGWQVITKHKATVNPSFLKRRASLPRKAVVATKSHMPDSKSSVSLKSSIPVSAIDATYSECVFCDDAVSPLALANDGLLDEKEWPALVAASVPSVKLAIVLPSVVPVETIIQPASGFDVSAKMVVKDTGAKKSLSFAQSPEIFCAVEDISIQERFHYLPSEFIQTMLELAEKFKLFSLEGYVAGSCHFKEDVLNPPGDIDVFIPYFELQKVGDFIQAIASDVGWNHLDNYTKVKANIAYTLVPLERIIGSMRVRVECVLVGQSLTEYVSFASLTLARQYYDLQYDQMLYFHADAKHDTNAKCLALTLNAPTLIANDPSVIFRMIGLLSAGFHFKAGVDEQIKCMFFEKNLFEKMNADLLYAFLVKLFFTGYSQESFIILEKCGLIQKLFACLEILPDYDRELSYFLMKQVARESDQNFDYDIPLPPSVLYFAAYWLMHFKACSYFLLSFDDYLPKPYDKNYPGNYPNAWPVINLQRGDNEDVIKLNQTIACRNVFYLRQLEQCYLLNGNPDMISYPHTLSIEAMKRFNGMPQAYPYYPPVMAAVSYYPVPSVPYLYPSLGQPCTGSEDKVAAVALLAPQQQTF